MNDELELLLSTLENMDSKQQSGELPDIAQLTTFLLDNKILALIAELKDSQQKSQFLLRFQASIVKLTELFTEEKKQVFNELEKLQLAKKGSARYHHMQDT